MPSFSQTLVSVVVPIFNREAFILQCIASVSGQTHRPIELLLVDDGSTDKGIEVAESRISSLQEEGIALRILSTGGRKGAPVARNLGTREAKGDFIQYLDSDDYLLPEKIAKELEVFATLSPTPDIVYSIAQSVDKEFLLIPSSNGKPLTGSPSNYSQLNWQTMCALYSRESIERIGPWREDLIKGQDLEFGFRAILSQLNIYFLEQINSLHVSHDKGQMSDLVGKENLPIGLLHTSEVCMEHLQRKQKLNRKVRKKWFGRLIPLLAAFQRLENAEKKREALKLMDRFELGNSITRRVCKNFDLSITLFYWKHRIINSISYRFYKLFYLTEKKDQYVRFLLR